MGKYSTVIFDLDGTLVDSLQDLAESVNYVLRYLELPERSIDEIRQFVGNGIQKLLVRALMVSTKECHKDFNEELLEHALVLFRTYYHEHCQDNTKPYNGIIELLNKFKENDFKIAIVSNKPHSEVKKISDYLFENLIDLAYGENELEGVRKKPAPDMIQNVFKALSVESKSCIYIGDSEVDIETAKNAGIDCVSVLWGFRNEEFLRGKGGEIFAYSPSELYSIVSSK
ncbi:MAG: HAD-IA family hydrolase [Bacteroidales bacterium]|nr:HAD-IA family hydrolase [Bacteroidales bacterium]